MPKQPAIFDRLLAVSGASQPGNSLYRWMIFHHARFAEIIARRGRPSWKQITAELTAEGLTKVDGKPLNPGYVRQAWCKAQARKPVAVMPVERPVLTDRPDWPVRPGTQPKYLGTTELPPTPAPSRYQFGGASLKSHKEPKE